jgi:hypothetical protein
MSAASQFDTFRRRIGMAAIISSVVVVVLGSSVSIATGEWIAFVARSGSSSFQWEAWLCVHATQAVEGWGVPGS